MRVHLGLLLFSPRPGAHCMLEPTAKEQGLNSPCFPSLDLHRAKILMLAGLLQRASHKTIQRKHFSAKTTQQSAYFHPFNVYSSHHRMQGDQVAIATRPCCSRGAPARSHAGRAPARSQKPALAGSTSDNAPKAKPLKSCLFCTTKHTNPYCCV